MYERFGSTCSSALQRISSTTNIFHCSPGVRDCNLCVPFPSRHAEAHPCVLFCASSGIAHSGRRAHVQAHLHWQNLPFLHAASTVFAACEYCKSIKEIFSRFAEVGRTRRLFHALKQFQRRLRAPTAMSLEMKQDSQLNSVRLPRNRDRSRNFCSRRLRNGSEQWNETT